MGRAHLFIINKSTNEFKYFSFLILAPVEASFTFLVYRGHLNIIVALLRRDNLWRNPLKTTKIQYMNSFGGSLFCFGSARYFLFVFVWVQGCIWKLGSEFIYI